MAEQKRCEVVGSPLHPRAQRPLFHILQDALNRERLTLRMWGVLDGREVFHSVPIDASYASKAGMAVSCGTAAGERLLMDVRNPEQPVCYPTELGTDEPEVNAFLRRFVKTPEVERPAREEAVRTERKEADRPAAGVRGRLRPPARALALGAVGVVCVLILVAKGFSCAYAAVTEKPADHYRSQESHRETVEALAGLTAEVSRRLEAGDRSAAQKALAALTAEREKRIAQSPGFVMSGLGEPDAALAARMAELSAQYAKLKSELARKD